MRIGLWKLACITVLSWIGPYGSFSPTDHFDSGNGSLVDNDLRVVEWLKLNLNMAAVSCTVILWFGLFVRWLYLDKPWTY